MYPHLLSPVQVGRVTLPNRVVMGSMHLGLEEVEGGFERMAEFYATRARAGVGLIVTGGIAPSPEGCSRAGDAQLTTTDEAAPHRLVTNAVHRAGGRIILQLLHCGRYAHHNALVAPSAVAAPINRRVPRELAAHEVGDLIAAYAEAARLAVGAGYDGVEIMGSEGYLINQFLAPVTNRRTDAWGGTPERRRRFALEVVRAVRAAVGLAPLLSFRLSVADLVPGGADSDEVLALAADLPDAGVDLLDTGVGWHESRVPTIASPVPRAAFAALVGEVRRVATVPVVASNRINTPDAAERVLADGHADLVALARPLLADPGFVRKAAAGRAEEINTCIGCNQACIDHSFSRQVTSCLVNPQAGHETLMVVGPALRARSVAVVGAGPAGLAAAVAAAERGHQVDLFEAGISVGGLFDLARRVPGKEEYAETLRYFSHRLARAGVRVHLETRVSADDLAGRYDDVVVATGVRPRIPEIDGVDRGLVVTYEDVLSGAVAAGERAIVLGAGGIGVDVAQFLGHGAVPRNGAAIAAFARRWGVAGLAARGSGSQTVEVPLTRRVRIVQRKPGRIGGSLGVTTGWIHRSELRHLGVEELSGVTYRRIEDDGLVVEIDGDERLLEADQIVLCAGQVADRTLYDGLVGLGQEAHLVGGVHEPDRIDAARAIREATLLGLAL